MSDMAIRCDECKHWIKETAASGKCAQVAPELRDSYDPSWAVPTAAGFGCALGEKIEEG